MADNKDNHHRKQVLCFRGAGLLAFYFFGTWKTVCDVPDLQKLFGYDACVLRGISSGSLVATMIADEIPFEVAVRTFHEHLRQEQQEHPQAKDSRSSLFLRWGRECRVRFGIVAPFVRSLVLPEHLPRLQGRLSIAVFSFRVMAVICNDRWRDIDHLIEWLLAAMTIPFITSWPRTVTTFEGETHLAMDAFNFDLWRPMRVWAWIWNWMTRVFCWLTRRQRPRMSEEKQQQIVQVSPIENIDGIKPQRLFSIFDVIKPHAEEKQRLLFAIGRLAALRYWTTRLEHNLLAKYARS